jgi:transcriptional regulator of acetoin/glycerol metabolism
VLQERLVSPLGSTKSLAVDVSIISATHCNLREMIDRQTFREDLYYRLNGLVVRLPALRDRCDLDVVARRILLAECPHATPGISPQVMALFKAYAWPGNVRQLANVLRTASVMAAAMPVAPTGAEGAQAPRLPHLPHLAHGPTAAHDQGLPAGADMAPVQALAEPAAPRTLGEAEVELIRKTLADANGNISEASKRLGISRNTIYRKLRWGK